MASIEIAPEFTQNLHKYVDDLQEQAIQAAEKAALYLHDTVVARARLDPEWSSLADNIEMWSEDGYLVLGVKDSAFVSQAFQLEYGDEERPPNPLFRTLGQNARGAAEAMTEHMEGAFGLGGQFQ